MDAQRSSFVLTIAALFAGTALAAPPSQSTSDWSSAGITTAPTISASPNSRYANPQGGRTQNTVNTVNTAAPQSYGTTAYPAQTTSPFAVQPTAPPTSAATRNNPAPPPWPTTSSSIPAPPPTSNWGASTPATPVDRSLLANPSPPPATSDWSSIGSTIAAPPMLLPQLPSATNSIAPLNTTSSFDSGPSITTDSYRGTQPSFGSSANSIPQSSTPQSSVPATSRTAPASENWAGSWDGSAAGNTAAIGSNNSSRPAATREPDFQNSQRVATNSQDTRTPAAHPADSWSDDSWSRNSQANKPVTIGSAGSAAPSIQAPSNAPQLSPPPFGPPGSNNVGSNGTNPYAAQQQQQQQGGLFGAKPPQTAGGEPQPWATLLGAILLLAFSIAGNVYLGWSYMDARQKYQALVRRTADTFRRTKVAA
jgi:hypothetical protein